MLDKPKECLGCPWYGDGKGFCPDEIIPGAKVNVYLQGPGEQEEQEGKPAIGPTGQVLNQTLLPRAGLSRGVDVSVCNALRCRWNHTNKLPRGKELEGAIRQCRQYDSNDSETKLTVAAGATAWQAFNGPASITDWRGFLAPNSTSNEGRRILGTLHPADLFRNPKMRLAVMNDWQKVKSYLEGTWPQEIPTIITDPYQVKFISGMSFDTEYDPHSKFLHRFSITTPDLRNVYVIEARDWFSARYNLLPELHKAFEAYTLRKVWWPKDTQFSAWNVPQVLPESWTREAGRTNKGTAEGSASLDGVSTETSQDRNGSQGLRESVTSTEQQMCYLRSIGETCSRPLSQHKQTSWPLVLTLQSGNWVNGGQHPAITGGCIIPFKVVFQNAIGAADLNHLAKVLPEGTAISVEDVCLQHACLWSDWPHTLEFLASMYSKYEKMKHLSATDPVKYAAGDAVDTICVHEGLQSEFKRDSLSKSIYETQSLPLIPILLKRMKLGIRVNKARVEPAIEQYKTLVDQAQLLAKAYAGWPINIGSDDQLKSYLYDYLGLPVQKNKDTKQATTNGDAIATLRQIVGPEPDLELEERKGLSLEAGRRRVVEGGNGVLEGRVIYAGARQILSHYLLPLLEREKGSESGIRLRIYPDFKINAQASGRWSITDPPLAQIPEDLRDIIIPDEGMAWIAYDWDQIELRLLAALANDTPYLEAFKRNEDVHTLNARAIFDDSTIDKNDPRRAFAKRFVYRLNYGGEPRSAGNIPGAKQLGLVGNVLVGASNRYLATHPAMARWKEGVAQEVRSTGVSRTFMGRRRRFLGDSMSALREAYNHPLQGGVADILNTTTIQIAKALPYATLVYTMHDAATWEVPSDKVAEATSIINAIVTQEWNVGSLKVSIPAKFKETVYGS